MVVVVVAMMGVRAANGNDVCTSGGDGGDGYCSGDDVGCDGCCDDCVSDDDLCSRWWGVAQGVAPSWPP